MPAITANTRVVLWVIAGVAALLVTLMSLVLEKNLVYKTKELFKQADEEPPPPKPKRLWSVFWLSAVVMILGGAVASSAPETVTTTPVPSPPMVETQIPSPSDSQTPDEISIELRSLTSPVSPGEYAKLVIQTAPDTDCDLIYETPKGTDSGARGLGECHTDEDGFCSWRWFIGTETDPGIGMLTVSVGEKKEVFSIEINE